MVKLLLVHKVDISAKFPASGQTPLRCAVDSKRYDIWPLLLNHGADYNDISIGDGGSMLHFAAAQGNDEGIRALLRKGVDASAVDNHGLSAFHAAVGNGQLQSLKLLIESTDELPARDKREWTLLHLAARQGFAEMTEFLISKEQSVWIRDNDGLTPLHLSALNKNLETVIHLANSMSLGVNKGIEATIAGTRNDGMNPETNINSKDFRGRTAIFCASQQGHRDVVALLADRYNAKVDCTNNNGITPLAEAACWGHTEVVKTLAEKFNADCSIASSEGRTALHCAIRGGHLAIVEFLISRSEHLEHRDKVGNNGLTYAVIGGRAEMIRRVVEESNRDLAESNTGPWPFLHWACRTGDLQTLKMLLEAGCKARTIVDVESGSSWCPLSIAAFHCNGDLYPQHRHVPIDQACEEQRAGILRRLCLRDLEYRKGVERQACCDLCLNVSVRQGNRLDEHDRTKLVLRLSMATILSA